MADPRDRDRNDLVLVPRQYAFVKDVTKGNIGVCVGPFKISLSDTDRLMVLDRKDGCLHEVADQAQAIMPFVDVAEGEYVVMTNPANENKSPENKRSNEMVELNYGRRVNIPGPVSFALWPFQVHSVITGHQLRINQFLVIRVVNDQEALKNWSKAIVKPQVASGAADPSRTPEEGGSGSTSGAPSAQTPSMVSTTKSVQPPATLSVGQLIVIRGNEVSFYIPPTGLEVVKDAQGNYVRDAVTLEQLEYCVLVDQNGEKRFEHGPQVVFPKPSEDFVTDGTDRKFKAIELTEISGLHIKVTAPYKDSAGEHEVGDELFITGKTCPIYYPRAEHTVIKYGNRTVHYATAVPKGEGRYILNRLTGEVSLIKGPKMLLPDPRKEVIVRRILTPNQVALLYPNNTEAVSVNRELEKRAQARGFTNYLHDADFSSEEALTVSALTRGGASSALAAQSIGRGETYTPPRTVTLNTKYDGAVQVDVWTGYAALVVDKSGKRQVVVGPETILLEFDQMLTYMDLSTGKPKNTDTLLRTAFLRVLNNRVSDIITAFTADDIEVKIKVSYRVNFEAGHEDIWFDVDNYVKLLCDHARSRIRNAAKRKGIQEFDSGYIDLVRDTILGVSEGEGDQKKPRPGMLFKENGMHVYDVEVLGLEIGDSAIANQLINARHSTIRDELSVAAKTRELRVIMASEKIAVEIEEAKAATSMRKLELSEKVANETLKLELTKLQNAGRQAAEELKRNELQNAVVNADQKHRLAREQQGIDQRIAEMKAELEIEIERMTKEAQVLAERAKSVTPELIAALQVFGDKVTVTKMAEAMAPLAILGGNSVADVVSKMFKGTGFETVLASIPTAIAATAGARSLTPVGNGIETRQ